MAKHATELTLDYIHEFARGYNEESVVRLGDLTRKYAEKNAPLEEFRILAPATQQPPDDGQKDSNRRERLIWHRTTELILIGPWIRNLPLFADPSHPLCGKTDEALRSAIRRLIEVTVLDTEVCDIFLPCYSCVSKYISSSLASSSEIYGQRLLYLTLECCRE